MVRVAVSAVGQEADRTTADAWVLTPANHLLERKELSAAYSILPGPRPTSAFVTNLSHRNVWLPKRACIGFIESAQIQVDDDDQGRHSDLPESKILLTKEDLAKQLNPALDEVAKERALALLWSHIRVFAQHDLDLGLCKAAPMHIDTGDAKPICSKPFVVSWKARALQKIHTDNMMKQGIIEPSNSPWKSPVVLTKKSDGTFRFCVYFRLIDRVTVRDTFPLMTIQGTLLRLEGSVYFSSMDLQAGYFQYGIDEAPYENLDSDSFLLMRNVDS
jgi:hypothetical protein